MIFDIVTLSLLWFFTAGVSLIAYLLKFWPGGVIWFWVWNAVTLVIAIWELYIYIKYKMTLTRLVTKAGTDKPKVIKHKWMARLIVICYMLGALSLGVHLWPW